DVGGFTANRPQQSVKLRTGHIRAARDNKNVSSAPLWRGKGHVSGDSSCQVCQIFSNFAHMKTTTSSITNSMNRSPVRLAFLLIPLVLAFAWFVLAPQVRAVCQ